MGKPRNCCASNRIAQPLARQRNAAAPHIRVLLNTAPTQPFQKMQKNGARTTSRFGQVSEMRHGARDDRGRPGHSHVNGPYRKQSRGQNYHTGLRR